MQSLEPVKVCYAIRLLTDNEIDKFHILYCIVYYSSSAGEM